MPTHEVNPSKNKTTEDVLADWGFRFFGFSLVCLGVGGGIVEVFFPHRLGQGLDSTMLAILIPIWMIGIAGIVLMLLSWLVNPACHSQLRLDIEKRADGRYFGRTTKFLATLLVGLMIVSMVALILAPEEEFQAGMKFVVIYFFACPLFFLFFLLVSYAPERHRAITTYFNRVSCVLGVFLVPLTWPLLLVFDIRARFR